MLLAKIWKAEENQKEVRLNISMAWYPPHRLSCPDLLPDHTGVAWLYLGIYWAQQALDLRTLRLSITE